MTESPTAESAFIAMAGEWRAEVEGTPKDQWLSGQTNTLALSCLLLAVEEGKGFTAAARKAMKRNCEAAESRPPPNWMDAMPWRLCLTAHQAMPLADKPAVRELTDNLDHHNSGIRYWMMTLGWFASPWMNPVDASVRLLRNLANTLGWAYPAAGLAARFFDDKKEAFFAFAKDFKPPAGFEDQYRNRFADVERWGILHMQARFWHTEALCRKEIARAVLETQKHTIGDREIA